MSTAVATPKTPAAGGKAGAAKPNPRRMHRVRLRIAIAIAAILIATLLIYGFPYYRLDVAARVASPLHKTLKPSGTIGLRLGMLGFVLFVILFLYAIRKRVRWLSRIGKSGNWIDFHVVCGIAAPLVVTLHSSFKLGGLAGVAYWVMMSVAFSGFVGRYLYGAIPRRLNEAELSHNELETLAAELAAELQEQKVCSPEEVAGLLDLPSRDKVSAMPLLSVLATMLWLDVKSPFELRRLRARRLTPAERIFTLGGLLPSSNQSLERVIGLVRRQNWLRVKLLFLERVHALFHLWHVVHRPFSYSFAVLVAVHIAVVTLLGYY